MRRALAHMDLGRFLTYQKLEGRYKRMHYHMIYGWTNGQFVVIGKSCKTVNLFNGLLKAIQVFFFYLSVITIISLNRHVQGVYMLCLGCTQ